MATKKTTKRRSRTTARKASTTKKSPAKKATSTKKSTARKGSTAARKSGTARKSATGRKSAAGGRTKARAKPATRRKKAAPRPATPQEAAPATPAERRIRPGLISHTDLASSDPAATVEWCQKVFGWKFGEPMQTPTGPYHMWQFSDGADMGGGIRTATPEMPGTVPYVEVPHIRVAHDRAVREGATSLMPPSEIPGGMGWIAVVSGPGGVNIGLWAPQ